MNTIESLVEIINKYDLRRKRRFPDLCNKRFAFSYHAYHKLNLSYPQIAILLEKEDHVTIMHAVKRAIEHTENKNIAYAQHTWEIRRDLEKITFPVKKERKTNQNYKLKENPFVTLINRLFEARDMQDIEALKAFVNENINPEKLK